MSPEYSDAFWTGFVSCLGTVLVLWLAYSFGREAGEGKK